MLLITCFEIRVEFEASIDLNSVEDESGEMPSIIDEDEWTQQNFGDSLRLAQEHGNQDDDDDDDEDEEDNNTEGRQGNTSDDYDSDELELEGKSFHTSCFYSLCKSCAMYVSNIYPTSRIFSMPCNFDKIMWKTGNYFLHLPWEQNNNHSFFSDYFLLLYFL